MHPNIISTRTIPSTSCLQKRVVAINLARDAGWLFWDQSHMIILSNAVTQQRQWQQKTRAVSYYCHMQYKTSCVPVESRKIFPFSSLILRTRWSAKRRSAVVSESWRRSSISWNSTLPSDTYKQQMALTHVYCLSYLITFSLRTQLRT